MNSPCFDIDPRVERTSKYFMGCDLGQTHDPTAIAVVRRERVREWIGPAHNPRGSVNSESYQLGFLERVPLGTTYPKVVSHVGGLLRRPTWAGNVSLSIDATGVGKAVCDLFQVVGTTFRRVVITGGDREGFDRGEHRVPKLQLVSRLQALLHEGKLQIQKDLIDAPALVRELQDFRVAFTDAGRMQFGAREGSHDDTVLALAIAIWDATRPPRPVPTFGHY